MYLERELRVRWLCGVPKRLCTGDMHLTKIHTSRLKFATTEVPLSYLPFQTITNLLTFEFAFLWIYSPTVHQRKIKTLVYLTSGFHDFHLYILHACVFSLITGPSKRGFTPPPPPLWKWRPCFLFCLSTEKQHPLLVTRTFFFFFFFWLFRWGGGAPPLRSNCVLFLFFCFTHPLSKKLCMHLIL